MSCGNVQDAPPGAEEEQAVMPRRRQVRRVDKSVCQRCRQSKSMYIIRNVTYCKPCFEIALHVRMIKMLHTPLKGQDSGGKGKSKNAQQLGGNRPSRQDGDVLLALSSGAGSTAMLHSLVSRDYIGKGDGKVADKRKGEKEPVWGKGWVVYVEFAGVLDGVEDRSQEVKEWVERLDNGLGWVGLRAEDVFDHNLPSRLRMFGGVDVADDGGKVDQHSTIAVDTKNPDLPLFPVPDSTSSTSSPLEQLRSLIASLPPASRPALLSSILSSLLTLVSQSLPNISHMLLGESSSRQAQRLIAGTALGRGWSLPLELASVRKAGGVTLLKPMKDLTTKEAAIYCHLKGLDVFTRNERKWENAGPKGKRDARGKGGLTSLEMLTEQFIAGLSVTHPATVSTINRTGDKLMFPGESDGGPSCPVCQLPVDPSALEWKSRTALTSLPNKVAPGAPDLAPMGDSSGPHASDHDDTHTHTHTPLAPMLCYGCLTTFTPPTARSTQAPGPGRGERVFLPPYVGENVRRVGSKEMRAQIDQFLIPDAE